MQENIHAEMEEIKKEIQNLKILLMKAERKPKRVIKLKGMLKGIEVSEGDIQKAKKSLFKFGA
ncbi:hypothetical protein [Candidatus Pyrohabitans sp.]|jgi:hypothetical protein